MKAMQGTRCCRANLQAHLEAKVCVILKTRSYQPKFFGSRHNVSAQSSISFRYISYQASSDDTHFSPLPSKPPHASMT